MHPYLKESQSSGREPPAEDVPERLRDLPNELRPPFDWTEFRNRARQVARPEGRAVKWQHAAAAATLTMLVAGVALWSRFAQPESTSDLPRSAAVDSLPHVTVVDPAAAEARAEASRRWLARVPAVPIVVRLGTRLAVTDLEDHIAWVDDALSSERLDDVNPVNVVALQRERARLVNSLAQVRYAETVAAEVR
jgi:hypothetical protein